jgi:hypothetical protein
MLVEKMHSDSDQRRKEEGQRFAIFKPRNGTRKPSERMLTLFVLHRIFGELPLLRLFSWSKKQKKIPSEKRGSSTFSPGHSLPKEAAQSKKETETQSTGATGVKKRSSIRDRFTRLSTVFRRGAFAPHPPDV